MHKPEGLRRRGSPSGELRARGQLVETLVTRGKARGVKNEGRACMSTQMRLLTC
jgi:hypothetical protein